MPAPNNNKIVANMNPQFSDMGSLHKSGREEGKKTTATLLSYTSSYSQLLLFSQDTGIFSDLLKHPDSSRAECQHDSHLPLPNGILHTQLH